MREKKMQAFTLIELLIVVAIIAILAAIAVPNFLEAQVRAKVGRAHADMRSIVTALESYFMDNNDYPPCTIHGSHFWRLRRLTTPIAYITSLPRDPFMVYEEWRDQTYHGGVYNYVNFIDIPPGHFNSRNPPSFWDAKYGGNVEVIKRWALTCYGPDKAYSPNQPYDASNGTRSYGDIIRFSGE